MSPFSWDFSLDQLPENIEKCVSFLFQQSIPYIAGSLVETGLFAILLILGPATLYVLIRRPEHSSFSSSSSINRIVALICALQLCATATHWCFTIVYTFAIITASDNTKSGFEFDSTTQQCTYAMVSAYSVASWIQQTKLSLTAIQLFLGDCLIVYRLYIAWSYKKKVMIFPIFTMICMLVCGVLEVGFLYEPSMNALFLSSSLLTNLYASCMIGYHVWRSSRLSVEIGLSYPLNFLRIGIECAGLYTLALIVDTCVTVTQLKSIEGPSSTVPIIDSLGPILSISICLLVLRVKIFGQQVQNQELGPNLSAWRPNIQVSSVPGGTRVTVRDEQELETNASFLRAEISDRQGANELSESQSADHLADESYSNPEPHNHNSVIDSQV